MSLNMRHVALCSETTFSKFELIQPIYACKYVVTLSADAKMKHFSKQSFLFGVYIKSNQKLHL